MSQLHRSHLPRRVGSVAFTAALGAAVIVAPDVGAPPLASAESPAPATVATVARPVAVAGAGQQTSKAQRTLKVQLTSKTQKKSKKRARFAKHSEAIVTIRSVRISRYVYRGGQRTIDRAVVAHYTGWPDTFTRPGRPGVYWLAAHNYGSHGPFHRLLAVKKGARITVTTRSGARYVYRVDRRRVVGTFVPRGVVWGKWGPTSGPPRAVLQTCQGSRRLLVFASLVSRTVS